MTTTDIVATAPATYGQVSVWRSIADQPPEIQISANLVRLWRLPIPASVADVQRALHALEVRHEALRTTFDNFAADLRQLVWTPRTVADFVAAGGFDQDADSAFARLTSQPFELERDFPWRYRLVAVGGAVATVAVSVHHMAADGWALGVLEAEFRALLDGKDLDTDAPTCRELAAAQQASGPRRNAAAARYWSDRLAGLTPFTDVRTPEHVTNWAVITSVRARAVCLAGGRSTPQALVLAAYVKALSQRVAGGDILIGLIAGNRTDPRWRGLVSSLDQLIPLRIAAERAAQDLGSLVQEVQILALQAYRHALFDVDVVADATRSTGFGPAGEGFEYFFNYREITDRESIPADAGDPHLSIYTTGRDNGFPLYLRAVMASNCLAFKVRHCTLPDQAGSAASIAQKVEAGMMAAKLGSTAPEIRLRTPDLP